MIRRFEIWRDGKPVGEGVEWGHFVEFRMNSWTGKPNVPTRKLSDVPDLLKDPHQQVYKVMQLDPSPGTSLTEENVSYVMGLLTGQFFGMLDSFRRFATPEEVAFFEMIVNVMSQVNERGKAASK